MPKPTLLSHNPLTSSRTMVIVPPLLNSQQPSSGIIYSQWDSLTNSKKHSKPQQINSPTVANHAHRHPRAPRTCTLQPTLSRRPRSGDYQKQTRLTCTTTGRTESQVRDAGSTTAMNSASTSATTPAPASRIFQPSGSATDDKAYGAGLSKRPML
jgi:hypothetical protein